MNRCRKRFFDKLRAELHAQGGLARTQEAIPFQAVPESSKLLAHHGEKHDSRSSKTIGRRCRNWRGI